MRLEVNGNLFSKDPDDQIIAQALQNLTGEGDSFAILSKTEMMYIQTAGSSEEGFVLEYQDGSLDRHFRCSDEHLDLDKVIWAFTLYICGDERWRTEFNWEKEEL
jgi:hypothetical protein